MSQDVVADVLNMIMNCKKKKDKEITVKRYSKLLLKVLDIAKRHGYIEEFNLNEKEKFLKVFLKSIIVNFKMASPALRLL